MCVLYLVNSRAPGHFPPVPPLYDFVYIGVSMHPSCIYDLHIVLTMLIDASVTLLVSAKEV